MTLYPIAKWKTALKFKYPDKNRKKPEPSPIVDKHLEFDDGKNCHGYVAYRFETGKIVKFYFTYNCRGKVISLFQDLKTKPYGIYRRYRVNNLFVEKELFLLLNREEVISKQELERIFIRFD